MSQTVTRTDRLKAAHEKLQEAVASIVTGDDWRRILKVASKFHRYSFNNHLMIFSQRPDATLVAGFEKWKSMGRHVRKGERKGSRSSPRASTRRRPRPKTARNRRCSPSEGFASSTSSTSPRPRATTSPTSLGDLIAPKGHGVRGVLDADIETLGIPEAVFGMCPHRDRGDLGPGDRKWRAQHRPVADRERLRPDLDVGMAHQRPAEHTGSEVAPQAAHGDDDGGNDDARDKIVGSFPLEEGDREKRGAHREQERADDESHDAIARAEVQSEDGKLVHPSVIDGGDSGLKRGRRPGGGSERRRRGPFRGRQQIRIAGSPCGRNLGPPLSLGEIDVHQT